MRSCGFLVLWLSFICMLAIGPSEEAKILLISIQAYSHCLEISSVGQELANRGHDVVIFLDTKFKHKNCYERGYNGTLKIRSILFQHGADITDISSFHSKFTTLIREGEELSPISLYSFLKDLTWHQCAAIFSDQTALDSLKAEQFDLAIVSAFVPSYCFFVLPYVLNIRYIALGWVIEDIVSARPFRSSIVPNEITRFTSDMNFFQRLINSVFPFVLHAVVKWNIPMDVIGKIAPELSAHDVTNLVSKSELFLYNSDIMLSYPLPTMPNHILVGGLTAQPAAPLTGIYEEFYRKAADGVVVVSFGSIISSLPSSVTDNLLAALLKLNIAVLWKHSTVYNNGTVKRVTWLPQNDILGHRKTRLFISHCGNNGVSEALYHGVPLVCTPIDGDQFYHGVRVQWWNVGISIPLMTSSRETIFNAINEVLNNSTYKRNMKKASKIYHSRPENARERAAFWIEHVLRFGGAHLQSPASNMSIFTYHGYDVFFFCLSCAGLIFLLFIKAALALMYRCLPRGRAEKAKLN